jgi:hypothetical protein
LTALWLAVAGGVAGGFAGSSNAPPLGVAAARAGGFGADSGEAIGATASAALGGCAPGGAGLPLEQPAISMAKASPTMGTTRIG